MASDIERALARYRVMAYVVGAGLILLVFVGMPLKYWGDVKAVVAVVGPIHGLLYIVYLVTVADLARRRLVTGWQLVAMVGAGLVPFFAFYVERRITAAARERAPTSA